MYARHRRGKSDGALRNDRVLSWSRLAGAVAFVAGATLAACGDSGPDAGLGSGSASGSTESTGPKGGGSVKVADSVAQVAARVEAARGRASANLAGLSNDIVHVRSDGAIEVLLHASAPVGDAELAALRRLGAEVVTQASTPSVPGSVAGAVVQAWVPSDRMADVAALAWVAAVTPPGYPSRGG